MAISKITLNGVTQMDLTQDTAANSDVVTPKTYHKADGTQGTGSITQRTSSDLSASGATVTVPAGNYAAQATKSVASGTVTAPSSISGTSATVTTGTNSLTLSKTVSVTPSVTTAGYVSSGTAGNASVSLSASVTTQAAQTIYPSASDQTIASGRYLTGAQTIKGVTTSNLTADNIKSGVTVTVGDSADADRILSVTGTYSGGGGGGSSLTLLDTLSMGTISTTSTSATNTNKSFSLATSNILNYDALVVITSVATQTNSRHVATIRWIWLTASSAIATKNAGTIGGNTLNLRRSSGGAITSVQGTTAYGIYPNSITFNSNSTVSIPMYQRYNSSTTTTINGTYTAKVYGINLYGLI